MTINVNQDTTINNGNEILQQVFATGFKMAGVSPVGIVTNATTTLKIAVQSLETRILDMHKKADPSNFQSGIFRTHYETKCKKEYEEYLSDLGMDAPELASEEEFNAHYLQQEIELYNQEATYLQQAIQSLNDRIGKASHPNGACIDEIKNNYDLSVFETHRLLEGIDIHNDTGYNYSYISHLVSRECITIETPDTFYHNRVTGLTEVSHDLVPQVVEHCQHYLEPLYVSLMERIKVLVIDSGAFAQKTKTGQADTDIATSKMEGESKSILEFYTKLSSSINSFRTRNYRGGYQHTKETMKAKFPVFNKKNMNHNVLLSKLQQVFNTAKNNPETLNLTFEDTAKIKEDTPEFLKLLVEYSANKSMINNSILNIKTQSEDRYEQDILKNKWIASRSFTTAQKIDRAGFGKQYKELKDKLEADIEEARSNIKLQFFDTPSHELLFVATALFHSVKSRLQYSMFHIEELFPQTYLDILMFDKT